MSGGGNECRIYVGNLPPDIRSKDIDDLFHKYGKIVFIDLKNRRGPPFAFVEFEDSRFVFYDGLSLFIHCVPFPGMPRMLCTPGTGTTMTDTGSEWSFPRGEAAASEEGGQKGEGAEEGEDPQPGGASTGSQ